MLLFAPGSAGLLAPPAQAQEVARSPSALPPSPRGFLLDPDALAQGTAEARIDAQRAARLRPAPTPIHAPDDATPRAAAKAGETRGPAGNARFPTWNLPPQTQERGMVYASVGYGLIGDEFDEEGETRAVGRDFAFTGSLREGAQLVEGLDPENIPEAIQGSIQIPARLEGEVATINVNLGGAFDVYTTPLFSLALGADFRASQQDFETDALNVNVAEGTGTVVGTDLQDAPLQQIVDLVNPDAPALPETVEIAPDQSQRVPDAVESGFQTQALTLFARGKSRLFSVRGGFQFDLGDEPDLAAGEREVSDRQNAVLLGATAHYPLSDRIRVYGGVDGWFTLENEENDLTYDEGNTYAAQLGADFELIPSLALGAALTYRYRTGGSVDAENAGLDVETESGYNLGIGPYVNFDPPGLPLTLYLKGGVRDEYRDFSFSIAGENEFAPRAGATLGAAYRF
jgi:hypothetical protein